MKNLIKNIWQAPSSTIAGGLVAAIGVAVAADIDLPKHVIVGLSAVSAFLAVFDGPNKSGMVSKLPLLIWLCSLALFLPACSVNWSGKGWPTITVDPERVIDWTNNKLDRPDTIIIVPEK